MLGEKPVSELKVKASHEVQEFNNCLACMKALGWITRGSGYKVVPAGWETQHRDMGTVKCLMEV